MGLDVKAASPFKNTFVVGMANDYAGYLPTEEQHALGGYETWRAKSSFLETTAATKILSATKELLADAGRAQVADLQPRRGQAALDPGELAGERPDGELRRLPRPDLVERPDAHHVQPRPARHLVGEQVGRGLARGVRAVRPQRGVLVT